MYRGGANQADEENLGKTLTATAAEIFHITYLLSL